jgi:hypothetical protein
MPWSRTLHPNRVRFYSPTVFRLLGDTQLQRLPARCTGPEGLHLEASPDAAPCYSVLRDESGYRTFYGCTIRPSGVLRCDIRSAV